MSLEHSKAALTISFAGLALFCINKNKQNRCEVGIIGCERHRPVLDIQEVTLDPASGIPRKSLLVPHSLSLDDHIWINVEAPEKLGVSRHKGERHFNRLEDRGDETDFRWTIDLEGEEFHNKPLGMKPIQNGADSRLRPVIFISDGVLYTESRTDEKLARVSLKGRSSPRALGRIAFKIGADLFPRQTGWVELSNGNRNSIRLQNKPNTKYNITVENLCTIKLSQGGTDFRIFYDILNVSEAERFDVQRIVENGGRGDLGQVLEDHPDFSLDNFPLVCLGGFLGLTDSLVG